MFDREFRKLHSDIAGIDEAGRGPLAGPLVAAAVVLPRDLDLSGVRDSKKLTPKARSDLFQLISTVAVSCSTGIVPAGEIDEVGMTEAVRLSFIRAAESLVAGNRMFIVDGLPVKGLHFQAEFVIKADSKSLSVAAASIIAKVTRDSIMMDASRAYPGYGFERNMGYGTRQHLQALRELGPCPIHRRSFAPLKNRSQMRLPLE